MSKGIVMEQKKQYTIVMTSDGQFHRAQHLAHAEVGMEVQFSHAVENRMNMRWTQVIRNKNMKIAIVTLVFLIALMPLYTWYGSSQAYAYVNLDINPSVEMQLNNQMEVIDIEPQNKQAEEIIKMLSDWKKRKASEVTLELIQLSQQEGFVNHKNQVLIGISYAREELKESFSAEIESFLAEHELDMTVAAYLIPEDLRQKAHKSGESVNKFLAESIEKAEDSVKDVNGFTVEEEDLEIIQSFFNDESTSAVEESSSSKETIVPPANQNTQTKKSRQNSNQKDVANTKEEDNSTKNRKHKEKGENIAPGQLKKAQTEKSENKKVHSTGKHKLDHKKKKKDNNKKDKKKYGIKSKIFKETNDNSAQQKYKSNMKKNDDKKNQGKKDKNKHKNGKPK